MSDNLELLRVGALASKERQEQIVGRPVEPTSAPPVGRTRRCQRCQQIYDELVPRTVFEIERLQQTLFITGPGCHVELVFCDSCYEIVTETPVRRNNESSIDIGVSNSGVPNLLLQRLG